MTANGECLSRVGESSSGGDIGTTGNTHDIQNPCILVYSYRNNVEMWPTVVNCYKSTNLYTNIEECSALNSSTLV
jgi:hypothetical protein